MNNRNLSIYDWFGYEIPYSERYRLIKKVGFDSVVLWWSEAFNRSDYRLAPPFAREAGLLIENIHAPFESINDLWLDNAAGEDICNVLLRCVEDCTAFEIPAMVMHLSGGAAPPPVSELGLNRIERIAELAEKLNVNVALENLRNVPHLDSVLSQIDSAHIGFCYDSGHHNCRNPQEDLLGKHGARLMALHLHDNDGSDDQHRLPFDGTIDWKSVMRNIAAAGYKGTTALEVMNWGCENLSPEEFLQLAFERAVKLDNMRTGGNV
jgi:sugar phosphate isomerase/epimerase